MRQWFLVAVVATAIALIEGTEEIECPKNATRDEVTIPHETDCQKYYLCVGQEKVNMTCDQYKCFNPELGACDWPWMVPCCSTYVMTSRPFTCRDKEPYDNDCQKYLQNGILKCCPEYHFYRIDTCTCEPVSEVPPGRCSPPPHGEPPCWTLSTTPETTTIDMCPHREVYERDCQKYLENGERKCCPDEHFYSTDTCTCDPQNEAPVGRCTALPKGEEACWQINESMTTPSSTETTTVDMCADREVYERDCQKYLESGERKCCPDDHFYSTDTCTCEPEDEAPLGRCRALPKGEEPCWKINESITTPSSTETTTVDMCADREVYERDCQKYLEHGERKCCPDDHFYSNDTCTCEPNEEAPLGRCKALPKGEEPCWKINESITTPSSTETTTVDMCADREVYERDCQKYLEHGERKCCPDDHFYSNDTCTCEPNDEAPVGRCKALPKGEEPCWKINESITTPSSTETTTVDMCADREVYERDCQKYLEHGERKCCPDDHFYSNDTCTCEPNDEAPVGRCKALPKGEEPCWKINESITTPSSTETTTVDMCADREVYERDCQKYLEHGERKCCPDDHFYSNDTCTCEPNDEAPVGRCKALPKGESPCWQINESITTPSSTETTTVDMCADREVYERDCQKYLEHGERKCCPDEHFYSNDTCTCEPNDEAPVGRCKALPKGERPCWQINESTTIPTSTETTTIGVCADTEVYERDCQKYLEHGERKCCPDEHFYSNDTCTCEPEDQAPVGRCKALPKGERPCWEINDSTTIPAITVMSTTTVENKIPDASSSTTDVSSTTTGNSIADVSSTTTENSTADVSSTTTENSRADVSSTTTENSIADVSSTTTENNTPHASNLAMEYDEMVDDV